MPPTNRTTEFFESEVCKWRGYAAQVLSSIWLLTVYGTCLLIYKLSFGTFFTETTVHLVFNVLLLVVVAVLFVPLGQISLSELTVFTDGTPVKAAATRWRKFRQIYFVLVSVCLHAALSLAFLSLFEPYLLTTVKLCTDEPRWCVNDDLVLIILHSAFMGFISACRLFVFRVENFMRFPALPLTKLEQIRVSAIPQITESISFVLRHLPLSFIFLLLFGQTNMSLFGLLFGIPYSNEWPVLNFTLLGRLVIYSSVIRYGFNQFILLFKVYQTDPLAMRVGNLTRSEKESCELIEALQADDNPLLQYHGYYALSTLSLLSSKDRMEIYSLSAIGRHPHTWNAVNGECMRTLQILLNHMQMYNRHASAACSASKIDKSTANSALRKKKQGWCRRVLLKFLPFLGGSVSHTKMDDMLKEIKRRSPQYCWCLQALINLVQHSLTEDQYGVVQQDLPDIVEVYVSLYEENEKLFRFVCGGQRGVRPNDNDWCIFNNLRNLLKSNIYQFTNTFQSSVMDMKHSSDVRKKLQLFLDHRV